MKALFQVWLTFVRGFRSVKCEKLTDKRTNKRTTGNLKKLKLPVKQNDQGDAVKFDVNFAVISLTNHI